jgi:hypothetical protein
LKIPLICSEVVDKSIFSIKSKKNQQKLLKKVILPPQLMAIRAVACH